MLWYNRPTYIYPLSLCYFVTVTGLWPLAAVYHDRHISMIIKSLHRSQSDVDLVLSARNSAVTAYELYGESCSVRGLHDKAVLLFSEMVKYADRWDDLSLV